MKRLLVCLVFATACKDKPAAPPPVPHGDEPAAAAREDAAPVPPEVGPAGPARPWAENETLATTIAPATVPWHSPGGTHVVFDLVERKEPAALVLRATWDGRMQDVLTRVPPSTEAVVLPRPDGQVEASFVEGKETVTWLLELDEAAGFRTVRTHRAASDASPPPWLIWEASDALHTAAGLVGVVLRTRDANQDLTAYLGEDLELVEAGAARKISADNAAAWARSSSLAAGHEVVCEGPCCQFLGETPPAVTVVRRVCFDTSAPPKLTRLEIAPRSPQAGAPPSPSTDAGAPRAP